MTYIIAHRGACTHTKENTLEAYQKAIEIGADMIELDVRRTKDRVFIVFHDEKIDDQPIEKITYEEVLRCSQKHGFQIPTLEAILKITVGKIMLDVELKEKGYESEVIELVQKYYKEDEFVMTSFHDVSIKQIKSIFPQVTAGLLLGKGKSKFLLFTRIAELFPMIRCFKARADFLAPNWRLLQLGFLKRVRCCQKPVFVWTVNDEKLMKKLIKEKKVYALITDKPDVAIHIRDEVPFKNRRR
ncbi:glycerophosphodiester phosphodiesterase [Clostridiaceae bacterium 35-E11]